MIFNTFDKFSFMESGIALHASIRVCTAKESLDSRIVDAGRIITNIRPTKSLRLILGLISGINLILRLMPWINLKINI